MRYASPFKNEALALLKKYKPNAAMKAEEIARLTYQDAMEKADEAIASHEWDRAIILLKAAGRKADIVREIDKVNMARYNLAFCYYMNKQFYEAYVLAEHLARRYPQGGLSSKATRIAMQALVDAYNTYTEIDRMSDIDRLVELARYTAETWPDREEGDDARLNLGQISLGRGQYDQAIAAFESVRRRSSKWLEAQTRLGGAHWAKSRAFERQGNAVAAGAEGQKAIDVLRAALKARRDAGVPPTDPGLVGNVGDLAIVLTESGKATEALQLLDPIVKAQTVHAGVAYSRLMEAQLMAFIGTNQVPQAIATMKTLEQQGGGGASLTQLYLKLGKLLQRELDALKEKGNKTAYAQMHQSYKTFLTTLAGAKSGQTYESLEWAGESLLSLDAYKEVRGGAASRAQGVHRGPPVPPAAGRPDEPAPNPAQAGRRLARRAQVRRGEPPRRGAARAVSQVPRAAVREGDAARSRGRGEARASGRPRCGTGRVWPASSKPSGPAGSSTTTPGTTSPWSLYRQRETLKARQTLQGIMRLTPHVGSPEMKAKYEALLNASPRSEGHHE